ncbi:hypothetical protein ES703_50386 [subsurface metagenome]
MRKYMKYGIISIVAIIALGVGITAVVSAESPEGEVGSDGGPRQIFLSKVADILGLDEEQLADAFLQAQQEMRDEAQEQCLQTAVEEGLITEQEAEQIREWWDSRPEALQQLGAQAHLRLRNELCDQFGSPGHLRMSNTWRYQMNLP